MAENTSPGAAVHALEELDSYLRFQEDSASLIEVPYLDLDDCAVCERCKAGGTKPEQLLTSAAGNGHKSCAEEVLRLYSEMDLMEVRGDKQTTAAHLAARSNSLETLDFLLQRERELANAYDERGATPIHIACYYGHVNCVRCLLKAGARADYKDFDGATALHFAAASGHLDCLKDLTLMGGALPNDQTNGGETPAYFAAQEGHLDCVQWLVEEGGADATLASNDGMTPLHAAAQTGKLPITHWLVRTAKCPVTSRTYDGATPVHFAAARGHTAILEWMLHNALATGLEKDDYDSTPVHDAAEQGQLECLVVFHTHSVNLTPRDLDGFTPRDLAVKRGHTKCVAFLDEPQAFKQTKTQATTMVEQLTEKPPSKADTTKPRRSFSFLKRKVSSNRSPSELT